MNRTVTASAGWNRIAKLEKRIAELEEDREVQARINTEAITKLMQALSDCRKEQLNP